MKLKKNEDQSVDTLPLLRNRNKTPMEGDTEKPCLKKPKTKPNQTTNNNNNNKKPQKTMNS